MSKNYNHEIGYETLQSEWKIQLKRTPRGVSLAKKKSGIYLQFKTPSQPRKQYSCSCSFSIDGMHEAVRKSHLVKAKLTSMTSETEFWEWYKKEIEEETQLVDDTITFAEAIKKVEDDFWSRPDRRKQPRDKNNPSHVQSWNTTYGNFYKHLPLDKKLNYSDIKQFLDSRNKGSGKFSDTVSAMKKLCRMNKQKNILEALEEITITQTKFLDLQNVSLEQFLNWRNNTLGITKKLHSNAHLEVRQSWLWVFSIQVVYGLRIHEVFAIANAFKPYKTKDSVTIPALNDVDNTKNLIYIENKTAIGTTVKTGRIARPNIPPKYPNLIELLDIKKPIFPSNKPSSTNAGTLQKFVRIQVLN